MTKPKEAADGAIIDIRHLDVEGDGVGTLGGRRVRVPYVIPGERVEVRAAGGDRVELVRIVSPSRHRVAARCQHFGPCGGCAWQHIAYGEQLRLKQSLVERLLRESLGVRAPKVLPTQATPPGGVSEGIATPRAGSTTGGDLDRTAPWQYRNKVSFVFGPGGPGRPLVMGHYRRASRSVVPVRECPVHAETGNRAAFAMRDALAQARIPGATGDASAGIARHVVVRVAEAGTDWLATLVVTENVKPLRRVTATFLAKSGNLAPDSTVTSAEYVQPARGSGGLSLNVHDRPGPYLFGREFLHLAGARDIREEVAGISYVISPQSFFQTNVRAARVLIAEVLGALRDRRFARVLDLYAGVGLFALPLARDGRSVTAVEENRDAMAASLAAARENRVPARMLRTLPARVEDVADRLTPRGRRDAWDAVVLDPPREGCPRPVLEWLFGTLRPERIVYVSCNPEALARDLRAAVPAGYEFFRVQPIDMFPHTAHVETVVTLDRG